MAAENDKGTKMNETCIKHALNMPDIGGCPYCRIAELEQELTETQTAYDELRLLADGRLSIKPEYVRGLEKQLARYQGGVEVEGVVSEFGDILLTEPSPIDIGQRVCALVMKSEVE